MRNVPREGRCRGVRRGIVAAAAQVVLLVGVLGACAGPDVDPLQRARQAVDEGDEDRAIAYYLEYLDDHPDDYLALKEYTLTLGEMWAARGGDRGPLIENLQRLHEQRPGDEQVQGLLAVMLVREGQAAAENRRFDEAEAAYHRAIAVNPSSGAPQYHLGKLYEEQDRGDEAYAQYIAAAVKRPPIPDLYLRLGQAHLERGDPDRAIATLGLVLELQGFSTYLLPEAHCALAEAYLDKEMRADALEHLESATPGCAARQRIAG